MLLLVSLPCVSARHWPAWPLRKTWKSERVGSNGCDSMDDTETTQRLLCCIDGCVRMLMCELAGILPCILLCSLKVCCSHGIQCSFGGCCQFVRLELVAPLSEGTHATKQLLLKGVWTVSYTWKHTVNSQHHWKTRSEQLASLKDAVQAWEKLAEKWVPPYLRFSFYSVITVKTKSAYVPACRLAPTHKQMYRACMQPEADYPGCLVALGHWSW